MSFRGSAEQTFTIGEPWGENNDDVVVVLIL
jgi:hypothetical protein